MDILTVLILILIVYLIVSNKTDINRKLSDLDNKTAELKRLIEHLRVSRTLEEQVKKPEATKSAISEIPQVKPPEAPASKPEPPVPAEVPPIPEFAKPENIERRPEVITDSRSTIHRPVKTSDFNPPKPREPQPSFFERHPDLEKFIGENLINKIGIAILVLAIGYFVKFAIDNDWIGKAGRVGVGIACGAILIGIAHRLRNSYKAFSSVLVGGGLAVFYFTITLAYHQFNLFGQTTSFIILIIITIFAVVLSLLYDKQELAVIALVGGFASPFMVSTGNANYNGLFIYLLILNTGLLIIAYFKAWRILNIVSFGFTVIVFASILYTLTAPTYHTGFIYATIFYLLYFAINVAHNVKENKKFIASDFSILLINTALYFAAGLYLLTVMKDEQYRGLFCVSLAVVNLVLSYILFRKRKVDTNILYLLIGITLTFISLAAPIQLHGNSITIFWASEALLLYWLYQKSAIQLMKLTSLILWIAMLLSLFMDWYQIYSYHETSLTIIANKGFITTFIASISSYLISVLISRDEAPHLKGIAVDKHIFSIAALALLFFSGLLEINHQFLNHYPNTALNILYMMLYTPVFIYGYYLVSLKVSALNFNEKIRLGILMVCITVYLALTPQFFDLQRLMLEQQKPSASHFAAHWIGAIFIALLFYRIIRLCQKTLDTGMKTLFTWIISAAVVVFLSLELSLASNLLFYSKTYSIDRVETVYIKTGLPILWGLLSFALMWLGMRHKLRVMRIVSLSLFSLTLLKLFLFDINNIPVAGKIAAFFCLGVLLLIISFMYQKVKKIIVNDEAKPADDQAKPQDE
ncbi:DUF2339 domain-containing protein [Mucilaginibacter sabulilitoris]|uniref:DUF2339 domain-containing protein n=1 Tax=Mucilaginibacter sabulilitoris TaxID=1173583 RepID=A0ABZ0TPT6_9SPHI|nr:DUF2339 domain-containing protein [Mucilaginibacter sabulilitoris]WPU94917.1 DUF2339 domain-containing protein [Mucilaginibacter sabulilitoris]